jgi:multiple sugar transport system substrate-binding protein
MKFQELLRQKTVGLFILLGVFAIFLFILSYSLFPFNSTQSVESKLVIIKYADNISPAHQTVVNNFNKEFDGRIRVETINLPFTKFSTNERKELLTRSLRSKSDKLDLFAIDLIWSARFAKWAESLDKYNFQDELRGLIPKAVESCIIEDKLVALPMYLDISTLFYREDLLKTLPNWEIIKTKLEESITWKDFISLGNQFNSSKNPFYIFPADNYEGLICSFYEILHNQNPNFFQNDTLDWRSDEVRNSFQLLNDIVNRYKISPIDVTDYREEACYDHFIFDNGIFLRGWTSFIKDSKALEKNPDLIQHIKQVPMPHLTNSEAGSTIGGWNIMLSKFSENKEEALEFIKFILNEESQKIFYEQGAFLPVIEAAYSDQNFINKHPNLIMQKKLLDAGIHRPFLINYTKISDVISLYVNRLMKNQMSIDSALKETNSALISGELILR